MTTNQNQETPTTTTTYVYFFGIQFQDQSRAGFTNAEIPFTKKITGLADVQMIERYLRTNGYPNALVMGFNLLRTEQAGGTR